MRENCTATRKSTETVVVDGRETWPDVTVYSGRCKVQSMQSFQQQSPEAGGHTYAVQEYRIDIPVSAPVLTVGDVITVDSYSRPFRVTAESVKTYLTAQRLPVSMIVE